MITIYHNNRCGKSRQGLKILEKSGKPFEVIKYMETIPKENELKDVISKLKIKPIALVRTNETIWKDNYKGQDLSDVDIIKAMVQYPKLIERPIVINNDKAVIGRPPERILDII